MNTPYSHAIAERYDVLSGQECCLSCGGAINYANIQAGHVCVDLGSGKGYDVLKMATKAGAEGFAYGVDISAQMLATARANAMKIKQSNTDFIQSPLESIQLADNIADWVLSNCTINHSMQQDQVWKEIFRILKPGGHFVVSDIYAHEAVPEAYRNDPEAVAQCWAGAILKDDYFKNVLEAGFVHLELLEESVPYTKGKAQVASFTLRGQKPGI
jgi:arsenite methyltransferase